MIGSWPDCLNISGLFVSVFADALDGVGTEKSMGFLGR